MKTIWKYPLEITDEQTIKVPGGAIGLTAQMQGPQLCLWFSVNPDAVLEQRTIRIFETGDTTPEGCDLFYIASVQDGSLVWHVFERVERVWPAIS